MGNKKGMDNWIFYFLDSIGYPAFVLDATNEIIAANKVLKDFHCSEADCAINEFRVLKTNKGEIRIPEGKCLFCTFISEYKVPFDNEIELKHKSKTWRCLCQRLPDSKYLVFATEMTSLKHAESHLDSSDVSRPELPIGNSHAIKDISAKESNISEGFQIAQHLSIPVIALRNNIIVNANDAFFDFSGYQPDFVLGHRVQDFFCESIRYLFNKDDFNIFENKKEILNFMASNGEKIRVGLKYLSPGLMLNFTSLIVMEKHYCAIDETTKKDKEYNNPGFYLGSTSAELEQSPINPPSLSPKDDIKENTGSLGLHILYVEDKFVNRKVMTLMLESLGCIVKLAENGLEGIQVYDSNQNFDIILMDIQMPVMDGFTAVHELKAKYEKLPPIIAVTAFVDIASFQGFTSAGFCDVIYKPVPINDLFEKLLYWSQKS
ncbi:MAG: response regulator [Bacteroidales bacterium]|nr:response regulator [Bacteroidales bacterium]